jgi:hypothetical protein
MVNEQSGRDGDGARRPVVDDEDVDCDDCGDEDNDDDECNVEIGVDGDDSDLLDDEVEAEREEVVDMMMNKRRSR